MELTSNIWFDTFQLYANSSHGRISVIDCHTIIIQQYHIKMSKSKYKVFQNWDVENFAWRPKDIPAVH